jgi:hypothetical protein
MEVAGPKRILVAPLNWGIGHATRCIPLITHLLDQQFAVELAANGAAKAVLQEQFPFLPIHESPAFEVVYGHAAWSTRLRIAQAGNRLLDQVSVTQAWLHNCFPADYFQAIISDNQYGMYRKGLKNVLITHQLSLHSGLGAWADRWASKRLRHWYEPFHEIWVPDYAEREESLAGKLSHPGFLLEKPIRYIGPLSRLSSQPKRENGTVLFLISGPEPQRTQFEQLARLIRAHSGRDIEILGGNAQNLHQEEAYGNQQRLNELVSKASVVVARSGYSTVMDMVTMGKKTVWVPTAGQGEQQYIGQLLTKKAPHFLCTKLDIDEIEKAIVALMDLPSPKPMPGDQFKQTLNNWLASL